MTTTPTQANDNLGQLARVNLLVGWAATSTIRRYDPAAAAVAEACGLALELSAEHPPAVTVAIPGLHTRSVEQCVDEALQLAQAIEVDTILAAPQITQLTAALADAQRPPHTPSRSALRAQAPTPSPSLCGSDSSSTPA